jgi:hypothetical protein
MPLETSQVLPAQPSPARSELVPGTPPRARPGTDPSESRDAASADSGNLIAQLVGRGAALRGSLLASPPMLAPERRRRARSRPLSSAASKRAAEADDKVAAALTEELTALKLTVRLRSTVLNQG